MKLKNIFITIILVIFLLFAFSCQKKEAKAKFPVKPIHIVVYTAPGGLIDVTARKFVEIAHKYTDATFVVENKAGAGGIVAMKYVLSLPNDGYTLYAGTKSNISKVVASKGDVDLYAFDWLAMLMKDPECIITNKNLPINTWDQVIADAKTKDGNQIWVGPAAGGLDHVFAMKVWDKYGISAKWIPFKSGGKAIAALLGGQGIAYVGNPRDTLGKPDLKIAVVSSPQRLKQFPDVPTFKELGITGLDNEYMWRGFAVKKGIPDAAKKFYDEIFKKVTNDPDWKAFWEKGGIDLVYYDSAKFLEVVKQDEKDFTFYLKKIGLLDQ